MKWLLASIMALTLFSAYGALVEVRDTTARWVYRYNIISAFPEAYNNVHAEENADISAIFEFQASPDSDNSASLSDAFYQRRIEVYYTGGDWMQYGFVYFITDAEQTLTVDGHTRNKYSDEPRAYFIKDLSTTSVEDGDIAPVFPWNDNADLVKFIQTRFLDEKGQIRPEFIPQCRNKLESSDPTAYICNKKALPL